jgi:hypothetical protein
MRSDSLRRLPWSVVAVTALALGCAEGQKPRQTFPALVPPRGASLKIGDVAPDFTLPRSDGKGLVRLANLVSDKPVVLVFGSYT